MPYRYCLKVSKQARKSIETSISYPDHYTYPVCQDSVVKGGPDNQGGCTVYIALDTLEAKC